MTTPSWKVTLTPSQEQALAAFGRALTSSSECFILRGGAGTGKTRMIAWLVDLAIKAQRSVSLLTPTGRAARVLRDRTRLGASTIHAAIYAFDRLETGSPSETDNEGQHIFRFGRRHVVAGSDLVIVDEASMVGDRVHPEGTLQFGSGRLLSDLIAVARESISQSRHRGLNLVFVGDPAQLPPVGETLSPALNEAYLMREHGLSCTMCELTDVLRQRADSDVLKQATAIREAIQAQKFNRLTIAASPSGEVQETSVSEVLDLAVNARQAGRSHGIIVYSNARALDLNLAVRERLWGDGEAPPVAGDLLLVNRNSLQHELYNGDLVEVIQVAAAPESRSVRMRGAPRPVKLLFREIVIRQETVSGTSTERTVLILENLLKSRERDLSAPEQRALFVDFAQRHRALTPGSNEFALVLRNDKYFNALHAKYGYAMTCHKAQGGEWESVSVDFKAGGQRNEEFFRWAYTAITRTKCILQLVNPPKFTEYSAFAADSAPTAPLPASSVADVDDPDWNRWSFGPATRQLFPVHARVREALKAEGVDVRELIHEQYTERYVLVRGERRIGIAYSYKKNYIPSRAWVLSHRGMDHEFASVVLPIVERALRSPAGAAGEVPPFIRDLENRVKQFLAERGGAIVGTEVMPYRVRFTISVDGIPCKLDAIHDKSLRWTGLEEVGPPGGGRGPPGSGGGLREALAQHLGSLE